MSLLEWLNGFSFSLSYSFLGEKVFYGYSLDIGIGNNSKELRDSKEEASRVERNGESFDERNIISEGRDLAVEGHGVEI